MKMHIELDMTPEEARAMMGLPDVAPLQKQMLDDMRARMTRAMEAGDMESLMRAWAPQLYGEGSGVEAFQKFQKSMWDSATAMAGKKDK